MLNLFIEGEPVNFYI